MISFSVSARRNEDADAWDVRVDAYLDPSEEVTGSPEAEEAISEAWLTEDGVLIGRLEALMLHVWPLHNAEGLLELLEVNDGDGNTWDAYEEMNLPHQSLRLEGEVHQVLESLNDLRVAAEPARAAMRGVPRDAHHRGSAAGAGVREAERPRPERTRREVHVPHLRDHVPGPEDRDQVPLPDVLPVPDDGAGGIRPCDIVSVVQGRVGDDHSASEMTGSSRR